MGLILFIVSAILKGLVMPFAYLYTTIKYFSKLNIKAWDKWNFELAIAYDQTGNGMCKDLFNDILIKKDGYKFGNIDETISSVLGKNWQTNTLTPLGMRLSLLLNWIDANHVQKSIDNTEG